MLALLPLLIGLLVPAATAIPEEPTGAPAQEVLDSPRAVMRAFLEGIVAYRFEDSEPGLARAVRTFDLSGLPSIERSAAGEKLAVDLLGILDRVAKVDWDELPGTGAPELEDGRHRHTWSRADRPGVSVSILFERQADGAWLISDETVGEIPDIWTSVRHLSELEGLEKPQTLVDVLRRRVVPRRLQQPGFLFEHWQWIGLVLLVFLTTIVDRLARLLTGRLVARLSRGESAALGAEDLVNFERPVGIFAGAAVFKLLLHLLDLEPGAHSVLSLAASFVLTVAGVWAAYRLVDLVCGFLQRKARRTENKFDDMLVPLVRRTLKVFVVAIGLVYIASKWTEDLWGLVAGIGVGSLAVGFAARDSIENLFGTFTVLMDKPFAIGDWILVGDLEGTVEEVGFRSTRIRTFYNSLITVPNRTFISSDVDNMGVRRYRRIKSMLSLTYDTPPEKIEALCEGIRRIIQTHPYTRKDYYHVYLNQFAASSLDVLLYCFVETPDWATELRERHRLFADILRLAEKLGVGFAFPTQTIHVARPEDLEHPDRPATDPEGAELGRRVAEEVTARSLAPHGGVGAVPPPVEIGVDARESRGSVAEEGE